MVVHYLSHRIESQTIDENGILRQLTGVGDADVSC